MTKEVLKKMYQLLLTEPHAPTLCDQLESIAREALAQPEQEPVAWYDPTNRMVSTDKDSPLFTPLGQLWPLDVQRPWVESTGNEWFEWWRVSKVADETEAEIDFADFLIIAQAVVDKLKEDNK